MPFAAKYISRQQNLPGTSKNIAGSHFKFACVPSLSTLWATTDNNTWFVRKYFQCFFCFFWEERPSLNIVPLPLSFYWSGQFWSILRGHKSLWLLWSVSCSTICNTQRDWKLKTWYSEPATAEVSRTTGSSRHLCKKLLVVVLIWLPFKYKIYKYMKYIIRRGLHCYRLLSLASSILIGAGLDSVSGEEV